MLASGNAGKCAEFQRALEPLGIDLHLLSEFTAESPAETGLTFVENALIKARAAAACSNLPALADDSGLVVPALQGAPGIYSARFAGEGATDSENNQKLLTEMAGLQGEERQAYFVCALALMNHRNDPEPLIVSARWMGEITLKADGGGGFGYDPLFYVPGLACTSASLSKQDKTQHSHRGQAIKKLFLALQERNE